MVDAAPPWAALLAANAAHTDWIAAPPLPGGDPTPATILRVVARVGWIYVCEREPGTRLPQCCPELHVNGDSSFCLARRGYRVADPGEVAAFWQDLGEFLVNQRHAARRGRWPAGRWLSHGPDAANRQVEAEAIAARLGIGDDYAACLEADEGWIAEMARLPGRRIGRSEPCPRGCRDGAGRKVPHRQCRHGSAIQRIVAIERSRRAAHDVYFGALRRSGRKCCGRVQGCPLGDGRINA